jgi:hypothetical protein
MSQSELTTVVYELLDAHRDTIELAEDLVDDCWRAHLDYIRALQRRARELLAGATAVDQREHPRRETLR